MKVSSRQSLFNSSFSLSNFVICYTKSKKIDGFFLISHCILHLVGKKKQKQKKCTGNQFLNIFVQ